jgi:LAO/AO transport system kinase
VDPTSPFSGGALLGDRIRMERHYLDPGVYIRSLASRRGLGGLSPGAKDVIKLMRGFGFDDILLETVGVGQTELDVMLAADTVVVVLVPEAGDSIQAMKAGLMEIGDVFVVNKIDRPGGMEFLRSLESMLKLTLGHRSWLPPAVATRADRDQGSDVLVDTIVNHAAHLLASGEHGVRQAIREERELMDVVFAHLRERWEAVKGQDRMRDWAAQIVARRENVDQFVRRVAQ